MAELSESVTGIPAPRLRPFVAAYQGYRLDGFPRGVHVGMPSPYLTVIITIGAPIEIGAASVPEQSSTRWDSLASGLTTTPCTIVHDGFQHGIQLAMTPRGARALLGMPTAELGSWMIDLADILGPDARELRDRVSATDSWDERFRVLDDVLGRRMLDAAIDPNLEQAWRLLVGSRGRARVGAVADDIGWSRRHLVNRFTAEFGITPKDSARIARFDASHDIMRRPVLPSLAEVAAVCGYYDQAHMAREWRDLAGMSPSQWRVNEVFSFVQDEDGAARAGLTA